MTFFMTVKVAELSVEVDNLEKENSGDTGHQSLGANENTNDKSCTVKENERRCAFVFFLLHILSIRKGASKDESSM